MKFRRFLTVLVLFSLIASKTWAGWVVQDEQFGSLNYGNNTSESFSIEAVDPNATKMRVHFSEFNTEPYYDKVFVGDPSVNLNSQKNYSNNLGTFTSVEIDGSSLLVSFSSDYSVTRTGWWIDYVEYYVADGTIVNNTGTLTQGEWVHFGPFKVSENGTLSANMTVTGDPDLYVKNGSIPTTSNYDCRPYRSTNSSESCSAGSGSIFVSIRGYSSGTFDLTIEYDADNDSSDDESIMIWQQDYSSTEITFHEAAEYCSGLEIDGNSNWRVPTSLEFAEMIGGCSTNVLSGGIGSCNKCQESENCSTMFPNDENVYWTADSTGSDNNSAWFVNFNLGIISTNSSSRTNYIKCVSDLAPLTFEDANLETTVRTRINKPEGAIFPEDVADLTKLYANSKNIISLAGIEQLVSLKELYVNNNQIESLDPLSTLENLEWLQANNNNISTLYPLLTVNTLKYLELSNNNISNIAGISDLANLRHIRFNNNNIESLAPLSGLTQLYSISIANNNISDLSPINTYFLRFKIQQLSVDGNNISTAYPLKSFVNLNYLNIADNNLVNIIGLVDNANLGSGDTVNISNNNLSCGDGNSLGAKGITVINDNCN